MRQKSRARCAGEVRRGEPPSDVPPPLPPPPAATSSSFNQVGERDSLQKGLVAPSEALWLVVQSVTLITHCSSHLWKAEPGLWSRDCTGWQSPDPTLLPFPGTGVGGQEHVRWGHLTLHGKQAQPRLHKGCPRTHSSL